MTFRRDNFADTMHGINELSHVGLRLFYRDENEFQPRSVAFFTP
ncbi:putative methionine aminopeptidase [Enterobacter hormaechei]|nr:putative methionine aminopeptidase [Enterobacter hormaechei subsp. hoffmannii]AWF30141.1 putative methionine aminopeptidase [Enterobacter hormaechei]AWZ97758.1 putative methionine aminopeptidase [Enterobacter hormaechei]PRW24822.1 putative methionine aminopeptidase [Enterobacter hormaechei]RAL72849.1 putative methionine aminopeptidase [Enterobacter hormaechei]